MNLGALTVPAPSRPPLRYLGSKWRMAPKIIRHLPPHDNYVEPFGGSGAVLTQKVPVRTEVWNDLDGELVNLFTVLRGPRAGELIDAVRLTPYARREFKAAYEPAVDDVERARRLLVRSHMAHGQNGSRIDRNPGFRLDGVTGGTRVAGEWAEFHEQLWRYVSRWRGVTLESVPASELIARFDDPRVLIYADPPYVPDTRSQKMNRGQLDCGYVHEMTVQQHEELLHLLVSSKAMIVLSGYATPLYDDALQGWRRLEFDARAHSNLARTEVVWINPAAVGAHGLFAQ